MGQNVEKSVIGLEFASLVREPQAVFELGREDIVTDRPGQVLVAEVKKFSAEGGFVKLQEDQDQANRLERDLDAKVGKRDMKDFNIPSPGHDGSKVDLASDNTD